MLKLAKVSETKCPKEKIDKTNEIFLKLALIGNEVQVLLTQAKLFITRIEPLYLGFSTTNKQRFISLIFPKDIRYKDGILRTPEKSYLFKFIEELEVQKMKKTTLVTLRSQMTNSIFEAIKSFLQLFSEINFSLQNSQFAFNL